MAHALAFHVGRAMLAVVGRCLGRGRLGRRPLARPPMRGIVGMSLVRGMIGRLRIGLSRRRLGRKLMASGVLSVIRMLRERRRGQGQCRGCAGGAESGVHRALLSRSWMSSLAF
ncbi:MAG TPA: hypothetical protein VF704_08825 [Allosphingosinicella sp.]